MSHYKNLFEKIKTQTGMFIPDESYACVVSYLMGYDQAMDKKIFMGFKEWLTYKYNAANNLYWPEQILEVIFPDKRSLTISDLKSKEINRKGINELFNLFFEFDGEKENKGLNYILNEYQQYIKKKFP